MDDLPAEDHEMEESESSENGNRLSELPDSLILHTLSFLPMKDVVSTTLLSKRWRNLWTTVPCLNFIIDHTEYEYDAERIRNFVNRALIFWKGTKIVTFKIDFDNDFDMSLGSDIDLWVRFAKEKNVEELNIHVMYEPDLMDWDNAITGSKEDVYRAPQCLNSCSSIKKLSLVGCNLQIHGSPHWNQLKSLRIDGFCFSERLINRVLSGTPQLEVFMLRLLESYENLNIQSSSLKKLTIEKYLYFGYDEPSTDTMLRIWCPNLETLELSGVLYCKCLLKNVSSLTDATFSFYDSSHYDLDGFSEEKLLGETLRQIFPTIQHVEKVTLSDWCIQELGAMEKKHLISPLSNVNFLKLDVDFIAPDEMVDVLGIFPKLKMLVIEHKGFVSKRVSYQTSHENQFFEEQHVLEPLEFDAENSNLPMSFLLHLRTVEITSLLYDTSIFPFIEFLLKHASKLEKMVIRASKVILLQRASFFLAAEKLLSVPRSSPTAQVILCKN